MENFCYVVGISLLIISLLIILFVKVSTVDFIFETHNVTFLTNPTNNSVVSLFTTKEYQK